MKKTYMKPDMNVVVMQTQQMIAQSLTTGTYSGGDIGSRDGDNGWDDLIW